MLDGNARTVATLRRDLPSPKISARERDFLERGLADFVKSKNWPDRVARELAKKIPAVKAIVRAVQVSPDRVFVFRFASDITAEPARLPVDIFTREGAYLGTAELPEVPLFISAAPCISRKTTPMGTSIWSGGLIPSFGFALRLNQSQEHQRSSHELPTLPDRESRRLEILLGVRGPADGLPPQAEKERSLARIRRSGPARRRRGLLSSARTPAVVPPDGARRGRGFPTGRVARRAFRRARSHPGAGGPRPRRRPLLAPGAGRRRARLARKRPLRRSLDGPPSLELPRLRHPGSRRPGSRRSGPGLDRLVSRRARRLLPLRHPRRPADPGTRPLRRFRHPRMAAARRRADLLRHRAGTAPHPAAVQIVRPLQRDRFARGARSERPRRRLDLRQRRRPGLPLVPVRRGRPEADPRPGRTRRFRCAPARARPRSSRPCP